MKKIFCGILCCILLLTTACAPAPITEEYITENARKAYATVVGIQPPEEITSQQERAIMAKLAKLGVPVVAYHAPSFNVQQVVDFVQTVQSGAFGELFVCRLWQNQMRICHFVAKDGLLTLFEQPVTLSQTDLQPAIPAQSIGLFEICDSYLIYAIDREAMASNATGCGFRVEPLSADLTELCDRYVDTFWNQSTVLLSEWSQANMNSLDWNRLFEALWVGRNHIFLEDSEYPMELDGFTQAIPAAEVESLLTNAFPITAERLRKLPAYRASDNTYLFSAWRGSGYSPNYEVIAVTQNTDGSLTMTISAASVEFGKGAQPFCQLTVLPSQDNGIYLSNKNIRNTPVNKHQ